MRCGIIDIGTNTIRSAVFDVSEDDIRLLGDIVFRSDILSDTHDKKLSAEGISKLVMSLSASVDFFMDLGAKKIFPIATSAMRSIENFDEVSTEVFLRLGLMIDLIPKEKEAMCDYYALKDSVGREEKGAGMDLGGGSAQIFDFSAEGVGRSYSFPIGGKRLLAALGEYSSDSTAYIKEQMKEAEGMRSDILYMMGGTAKALFKAAGLSGFSGKSLSPERIEAVRDDFLKHGEIYKNIVGDRMKTFAYGADVILASADILGAKEIRLIKKGVREGYILLSAKKEK